MTGGDASLATGQRSLGDPSVTYPLWPPLTAGCPETGADGARYPLEVTYDYGAVDPALFEGPVEHGLQRWAPLLPPIAPGTGLGEGATPLVECPGIAEWAGVDDGVLVKDESRNPTWSQKDRLNRLTVGAAVEVGATGVVASSSGNHGAAAAAYAARAGLPCVVLTSPDTSPALLAFLRSYGAAVLAVDGWDARATAVDRLADEHGYHPVTSRTAVPTGHPFGPEGYKTIAYETYLQLDRRVPGTVFVPTAHAELLFGVWKGFRELAELGVAGETPRMVACEPAARGPLGAALERDADFVEVDPAPTSAPSIQATRSTAHGVTAARQSDGGAVGVTDAELSAARERLAGAGLWQETSGAASVAGLRAAVAGDADVPVEPPAVCLCTSSGFKDGEAVEVPGAGPDWAGVRATLAEEYDVPL